MGSRLGSCLVVVMAAALLAGAASCGKSPSKPTGDSGVDMPMSEMGKPDAMDAPKACVDDGTRNKDNGLACSCDTQCKSGFCVDGVCCDKACTGSCLTCALATSLGTCHPIVAGSPPRGANDCAKSDAATCGLDGMCDGSGQCERYPSGTLCKAGSCAGDAVTGRYQCDGNGTCKPAASTVCAPFSCDGTTMACFDACSSDADCVAGQTCRNGSCGVKMLAASCKADSECASGHCADGVCCNVACNTACRSCAMVGHVGTCSPTPQDQPHRLCGVQDPTTCGTTGLCDGFGSCSKFPANTPCGTAATCSGNTLETAQTCDGQGTCQPPEAHTCAPYRCTNGACTSTCTAATQAVDCADNTACVNESCGPKPDGQTCKTDGECQNNHCVDGVCCESACTGACRSCSLSNSVGKCTDVAAGSADPRQVCSDQGAGACATNGKCDGSGGCQTYPVGTACAAEDCTNDVYTGPSTCNASGQCIKPTSLPCNPYHCNSNKCYGACTSSEQCIPPNSCGQNGNISSCGPKPRGADCSSDNECSSAHCAQGKCCDKACTEACTACNLAGSEGTCSDVQSGADPQGMCMAMAQSTCGTTGMCKAGQCALYPNTTVCKAGSCEPGGPPSSALTPPSRCDGAGKCVTPIDQGCAPGRCDTTALMCVNTCTTNADCTSPNTCVNGSCGLIQKGGTCSASNQCASGLSCNHDKVCCDQTCNGVCETCKPPGGAAGTCTAVAAGQTDPSGMCVVTAANSCGTNGKCTGNNTAAGTARCQDWDSSNSCQSQSCANTGPMGAGMLTVQAFCGAGANAGMCFVPAAQPCGGGLYKCLDATQCRTSCNTSADCATGVVCNTVMHVCGTQQAQGAMCNTSTDCVSTAANCVDGVCCNSACSGACQACNLAGSMGSCTSVTAGTVDPLCPAAAAGMCGNTGACASGGACAKKGSTTQCSAATCMGASMVPASTCNGTDTCPTPAPVSCGAASCSGSGMSFSQTTAGTCSAGACVPGTTTSCGNLNCDAATMSCKTMCTVDTDCVNGKACDTATGMCTLTPVGQACTPGVTQCKGGNCVDGFCCNVACNSTCQACSLARTGLANGTCGTIPAGGADSRCVAAPPCGNDGTCTGTATGPTACKQTAAGTPATCPAASCTGDMLTPASTCNGTGSCTTPTAAPCPRNLACAPDGTACYSACTAPSVGCATGFMTCNGDGSCAL